MKKVLLMVCAASVLMLTACNKDNNEPNGGNNGPQPEEVKGDGVFRPAKKISRVVSNNAVTQEWQWSDGDLQSIQASDNGSTQPLSTFSYMNHRLASMVTTVQEMPMQVGYVYSGEKLTSISAGSGGFEAINLSVEHDASDKISRLTGSVDESLLGILSQFLGDGGFGGFFQKASGSKLNLEQVDVDATLQWQGDNVSQRLMNATVAGSITLGEIRQYINIDSLAGSFSPILAAIGDSTELPLTLTMSDTCTYTYDSHHNPYYGFLGDMEFSRLSANNVTSQISSASVNVTITLQTILGSFPIPFSYPMGSTNISYDYTYDADGYPLTVVDSEGTQTQYTYLQ